MALNFENIGTPVAKILDKNKKELKTVYLAYLELHAHVHPALLRFKSYSTVDIEGAVS